MLSRFISSTQNEDCLASLMGSKSRKDCSTDELHCQVSSQSSLSTSWNFFSQQILESSILSSIETASPSEISTQVSSHGLRNGRGRELRRETARGEEGRGELPFLSPSRAQIPLSQCPFNACHCHASYLILLYFRGT